MSDQFLYGTWEVGTLIMNIGGEMQISSNVRGRIVLQENGIIGELIEASFDGTPFIWSSTGSFYTDGNSLIMKVLSHNLKELIGDTLRRRFDFQPNTNNSSMMLHLPFKGGGFTIGMKRA